MFNKNNLKRFYIAINSRIKIIFFAFFLIFKKNNKSIKFSSGKKTRIKGDIEIYRRLFESYKKQKNHIIESNIDFKPSEMWIKLINSNYSELIDSYREDNFSKFVNFLDKFGHSDKYLGITFNILIPKYLNFLKKNYIKKNMLDNGYKNWNFFTKDKDYKSLNTPRFGNLDGGYINDDVFVSYTSFFNEIYSSILKNLLSETSNPLIGEIGPGYGEQAYFILKKTNAKYIAFDLPETLTLSSFYLMNSFKSKKTLLYGEKEFSNNIIQDYDLIFMPGNEISKIHEDSFDLMINKHSLGEMSPNTVKNYVNIIKKTSKLFFHINQSYYKRAFNKNSFNLLSHEYGFENDDNFRLILKYLDFCHFNYDNFQNYNMDLFFHIYKKIKKKL
jgi:hypothetical protein